MKWLTFWKKKNIHAGKKRRRFFHGFLEVSNQHLKVKPLIPEKWMQFSGYILSLLLSAGVIYIKTHSQLLSGANTPFTFLFTAVLISGWVGGMGPALLAAVIIISFVLYGFILPATGISTLGAADSIRVLIFTLEAILASLLLEARIRSQKTLKAKVRQQAVIAELGEYALITTNITQILQKAATLVTETLNVKYCKILELQPGRKTFLLRAGVGWDPGLIGNTTVTAGNNSQGGYTLLADKPVIVEDLKKEKRFFAPELLTSHGVMSGISVIIPGKRGHWGIFGVHTEKRRKFTQDDIYFTQAIANILATAIDKKEADAELRESEVKFRKLFESNIIGAFISDFNGKFLDANDSLLSLIGYTRQDLRDGKIQQDILTPPEQRNLSDRAVEDLKKKGISSAYEKEYITKSGNRVPVLIAVSRIDPRQDICIGFVLDMTKQKELERRKDEFISMASHELKTPVTTLKVLTQFISSKADDKSFQPKKYLDKMDKQVNNLTSLINELLDITKISAGKLELRKDQFSIDKYITNLIDDMRVFLGDRNITLDLNFGHDVLADRDRISQVVTNLITNAAKYSSPQSEIIIHTYKDRENVIVSVQDFGIGIDKKHQSKIFEQFFRVNEEQKDDTYPGLGMGLFISSEIIKRHGGEIWVESEEKKGSTFSFSLPIR